MIDSLLGLHIFMVHHPDETIARVWKMRRKDGKSRWHKMCIYTNNGNVKCDWIARMPVDTNWVIRFLETSMQPLSSVAEADRMAKENIAYARKYLDSAIAQGLDPNRFVFEARNEPQPEEWQFLPQFERTRISEANRLGVNRLGFFNFPNGNPGTFNSNPQAAVDWASHIDPVLPFARAGDYGLTHGYWGWDGVQATWGPGGDMKYPVHSGRLLHYSGDKIRWLLTECGCTEAVNDQQKDIGYGSKPGMTLDQQVEWHMENLAWADVEWARDGRIDGTMIYLDDTDNEVRWNSFRTDIDGMSDRLIAHNAQGISIAWSTKSAIDRWASIIKYRSGLNQLDPMVVATVVEVESKGKVDAVGTSGDTGLMQVIDGEHMAGRPSHIVLLNPDQNLAAGTEILRKNLIAFNWKLDYALAAYNLGQKWVWANGIDNPKAQAYLNEFRKAWAELWPAIPCPIVPSTPPSDVLRLKLLVLGEQSRVVRFNPTAALQKVINRDGFQISGNEGDTDIDGIPLRFQGAERLSDGAVRVY